MTDNMKAVVEKLATVSADAAIEATISNFLAEPRKYAAVLLVTMLREAEDDIIKSLVEARERVEECIDRDDVPGVIDAMQESMQLWSDYSQLSETLDGIIEAV